PIAYWIYRIGKSKSSFTTQRESIERKLTRTRTVSKIALVPAREEPIMDNENQNRACRSVGIEVSAVERITVCLADDNTIIASVREAADDPESSIPELVDFIGRLQSDYSSVAAIGVAVPGLIRRKTGRVDYSARIPSHAGVDIANEIRS